MSSSSEKEEIDWIDEALKRGMGFKTEEEKTSYLASIG
jgi:hypothetical protein